MNTLVDPGQIENAILNLAINARDAMEGRGRLTIEAGNAMLDDAYARLHDEVQLFPKRSTCPLSPFPISKKVLLQQEFQNWDH